MKTIIFFCIFLLVVLSTMAFTTKSSDEYLECLSKELYKECNEGINTCGKELKDGKQARE